MANKHRRKSQTEQLTKLEAVQCRPSGAPPVGILQKADTIQQEMGVTGLKRWGGTIDQEFLTELKGSKGRKVYTEMSENDPVVAAMLRSIRWTVQGVDWAFDGPNQEQVDFADECLNDMSFSWPDTLTEILSMLVYGWHWAEVLYKVRRGPDATPSSKYNDGRIGWRKWAGRSQNSLWEWDIDGSGGIRGMVQEVEFGKTVNIPIDKSLLFRTETTWNNPEGKSILRASYIPWYYAKNMREIEGIGIERDLAGLPVVYLGEGSTTTGTNSDYEMAIKLVRDIRRDEQEGVVIPKPKMGADGRGMLLELLSTGGERTFNVGEVIQRYEKRIAMSVLAQWLMLGMDQVGSYALSQDQTDFFRQALEAFLKNICGTINMFAVPRLFNLNPSLRAKSEELPQLGYSFTFKPDLQAYAQAVNAMLQGQVLDPLDEAVQTKVRDVLDLPELTEEQVQELEERKVKRDEQKAAMQEAQQLGVQQAQQGKPQPPSQDGKQDEEAPVAKAVTLDPNTDEASITRLFDEWGVDPAKFLKGIARPK